MSEEKEIAFETALKRLEAIVQNLEGGDLSLEQALKQYEEGIRMADLCSKRLSEAERRVEVHVKTTGGKFKTEPMEENRDEFVRPKKKK
jgi:exodeoxyribonuclease VII small subunit